MRLNYLNIKREQVRLEINDGVETMQSISSYINPNQEREDAHLITKIQFY